MTVHPNIYFTLKLVFKVNDNDFKNTRYVKDTAVSWFHFEKLLKRNDLIDISFERYTDSV